MSDKIVYKYKETVNKFKRDVNGLLECIDYIFNQDNTINWRSMINKEYGSYELFKQEFTQAGLNLFGSGWVWLLEKNGELAIATTSNQDNPIMGFDFKILLAIDSFDASEIVNPENGLREIITLP